MSAGSRIKTPFAAFAANGTAATPATGTLKVLETGVDQNRVTTIDIADLVLITTTAAAKADGKLLYTLPAGNIIITRASISLEWSTSTGVSSDYASNSSSSGTHGTLEHCRHLGRH
jgi:hypothetical protein